MVGVVESGCQAEREVGGLKRKDRGWRRSSREGFQEEGNECVDIGGGGYKEWNRTHRVVSGDELRFPAL